MEVLLLSMAQRDAVNIAAVAGKLLQTTVLLLLLFIEDLKTYKSLRSCDVIELFIIELLMMPLLK